MVSQSRIVQALGAKNASTPLFLSLKEPFTLARAHLSKQLLSSASFDFGSVSKISFGIHDA